MIVRGQTQTLSLDVYNDTGAQQTSTSGTLTLYAGSRVVVDGEAITPGAPSTYSLSASDTASLSLADNWLEVWSLTIGGTAYTFQREAYLVRRELQPHITDLDLEADHTDLDDYRHAWLSDFSSHRSEAWTAIQETLIAKGRRPQLVVSSWALRKVHKLATLQRIFHAHWVSTGDESSREVAAEKAEMLADAWGDVVLTYDEDEDGTIGASESNSRTATPTWWTNTAPRW